MARTESNGLDAVFRLLVTYRLLVYCGGLVLIGLPVVLETFGIAFPETAHTVLVVVILAVMVLTYFGEYRVGVSDSRTESKKTYPRRMRLVVAFAFVGIAVGVYVALEVNTLAGLLFIAGAYLFGYMGYRSGLGENE